MEKSKWSSNSRIRRRNQRRLYHSGELRIHRNIERLAVPSESKYATYIDVTATYIICPRSGVFAVVGVSFNDRKPEIKKTKKKEKRKHVIFRKQPCLKG